MSQETEEKKIQTENSYMPMTSSDSIYGKRYVGAKELVTLFVTAEVNKFNIEGYLSYFMLNVFGLDSRIIAAFAVATLAWDLVNDMLFAYIVDRTRTRFGKFKPWAFITIGPYAIACIALWITPLFIGGQNWGPLSWQKIVIYCVISILKETIGTLYNCAVNGLDSTFTPSIDDKAALIAIDNIGGFEKVPSYAMVLLLDLAAAGAIGISVENVYIFMGAGTAFVSALGMLAHICIIKERIVQVEEKPKLSDGLRNFFGNKLQVCLSLSNFLSAFGSVGGPFSNMFWLDVMGSASLQVICGVPAAPLTYISYMYFQNSIRNSQQKLSGLHQKQFLSSVGLLPSL
ncbi:MAG: MFS transporter [Clostridia bacterium]|nr:MFS transporter [Clostridia bacterium]